MKPHEEYTRIAFWIVINSNQNGETLKESDEKQQWLKIIQPQTRNFQSAAKKQKGSDSLAGLFFR